MENRRKIFYYSTADSDESMYYSARSTSETSDDGSSNAAYFTANSSFETTDFSTDGIESEDTDVTLEKQKAAQERLKKRIEEIKARAAKRASDAKKSKVPKKPEKPEKPKKPTVTPARVEPTAVVPPPVAAAPREQATGETPEASPCVNKIKWPPSGCIRVRLKPPTAEEIEAARELERKAKEAKSKRKVRKF